MSTQRDSALALFESVGRLLNAGDGIEATLTGVADAIRSGLPAETVTLWLREPAQATWWAIGSPPLVPPATGLPSLDRLPAGPAGAAENAEDAVSCRRPGDLPYSPLPPSENPSAVLLEPA